MKIAINNKLVEFTPENDHEKSDLEELWKLLVDCVKFNKTLTPVGEYVPGKTDLARFAIEGGE